jgi:ATP-dependent Lon protease
LERAIGTVCRGLAARVAVGKKVRKTIRNADLDEPLGPIRVEIELALTHPIPGVVTGLAYTPVGGVIIFVEATVMPGRGSLSITGQVGDVMRESAQAAMSLLRSRATLWNVPIERLPESDVHIHIPAGAIPKDGPSAGVAMLTALFTSLADVASDPHVGMTGEITLRGTVLPIGGVKEKVLGAHRAGLKTVILPAGNKPDLHEVPESVKRDLKFVFAEDATDVLLAAIPALKEISEKARKPRPRKTAKPAKSSTRKSTRKKTTRSTPKKRKPAPRAAARKRSSSTKRTGSRVPTRRAARSTRGK